MSEVIYCPHCGKPIEDEDALLCLYCGESLEREIGTLSKFVNPPFRIFVTIIVVLLLLSFLLFFIKYL